MADVKFVVQVDAAGGVKAIETLDQALAKLKDETKETVTATDDLGNKSESLWQQFAIGQMVVNAMRQAWGMLKGQVTEVIGAAALAEKADRSLDASLGLTGRDVQALSGHFKAYANELMGLTVYDDEAIKSSQALLIQLTNLDQQGIDRATKGAIGLASVFGMDLVSASTLVAKAMTGNMAALSRYGIKVDENLSLEQKRVVLLDKLEKMFGRATTDADTYAGRVAQLKNAWGEAQEEIGKAVTQNEKVDGTFKAIRNTIVIITPDLKAMLKDVSTFVLDVAKAATDAILWLDRVRDSIGESGGEVSAAELAWDNLSKRMGGFTGVAQAVVAQLNRTQQYSKDNADVNRQLWESFNTIGERATLAAIAAGKFGPEMAAAFAVVGGETLRVALAAAKSEEAITGLGGAAEAAGPKVKSLADIMYGLSDALKAGLSEFGRDVSAPIVNTLGTIGKIVGGDLGAAIDSVDPKAEGLFENLVTGSTRAKTSVEQLKFSLENVLAAAGQVMASFNAVFDQAQRNREIAIENEYKKKLNYINANIKDEAARQKAIIALEAEYQIKRSSAAAAGAKQAKAVAMMEAVVNTASAVVSALKVFPPWLGIAFASVIGALGAVQIGLIQKQPIPLAKGAVFNQRTLLPARAYEVAEANEPEIVSPKSTIRDAVREAFTSMPQMALAGAGGATVNLYITGPLVTTSGLSDSDLLQAKDKLVKYVNEGLRGTGRRQI